jgi:glutamate dehydrogenase
MISEDPRRKAARLQELIDLLGRQAPPEDRELLFAFTPAVYAEMPDRLALATTVEALAARVRHNFRFFAREMPPTTQLYRGLPGIHVAVRNPADAEAGPLSPAGAVTGEFTILETHTLDAPFIFESLRNYLRRAGLRVYSAIHPVLSVRRQWERIVWIGGAHDDGSRESFCSFLIERIDSKDRLRRIEHDVVAVLKSLFVSVEDFAEMQRAVREFAPGLRSRSGRADEVASARAFLEWLLAENYIFQGVVRYRLGPDGLADRVDESAAGVFTDVALLPAVFPGYLDRLETAIAPRPEDDRIIDIDHCNEATAIYHLEPIDDLVVRRWAPDGRLEEAMLLLGRFAKGAFTQKTSEIPLLRGKLDWLLERTGVAPNSHIHRETRALFNRFPTRELLYAEPASLKDVLDRIVNMTGDDEIAVHARPGRGYVALSLVFSRLRYSYTVEQALLHALSEAFGPVTFHMAGDLGSLSLLVFYFDAARLEHPVSTDEVQRIAESLLTTWEDRAAAALERRFGEREGRRLFNKYVRLESRSGLYRESTPPEELPEDIRQLDLLESRLRARLIPRRADAVTLKLFSVRSLPLTDTLRILKNLGLTVTEEMRIPLTLPESRRGLLYRLEIEAPVARVSALVAGEASFLEALRAIDEEQATDDALNGLVLDAGLDWREVELLRTLRNHLLQIRTHYNADTLNGVLLRNAGVAGGLLRLFSARFDPGRGDDRAAAEAEARTAVDRALEAVTNLAEDEVLRALDNLVRAGVRTNFFQQPQRPVFSIKVDSRRVDGMPSPRPMFEIYVHSRLIEGIHLRGGRVARGGIRWSDRHDDFRTEVLGLMKTQMVKNSIIVPVGSKGGFVLKGDVPARPALDAYLVDRYREFVSGLLDVTDNIVSGTVLHPPEVVRHDGEDPYLVVAADKGTAHLSDTANSVSAQYGFWLGDAFASGGSVGYDHKKVGITARGVWECVKHHFRNLGTDVQTRPFTMAGVGDMAGDVFGNGALQSRATKLVAVFNHVHIFIDPDPDPERSYKERERVFRLPRSSWRDYDTSLISRGGGVFDRSAKAIPISPEMRGLLEIQGESASGEEVVRRILQAKVDLLYNGGIGTYVKASTEEHADVGDRANDRVRVDARELRARVVAEGGNLGLTQLARLEYWRSGGLINTDAVDNSGGVDMSDHEVNLKILMDHLVKKGIIAGREERNRILAEMTEEVAGLVLQDNDRQALALSLDGRRSALRYKDFVSVIDEMVGSGVLSRADEAVPEREELLASPERGRGLARPLLAVLLGYSKMRAFEALVATDFAESPLARPLLEGYFPRRIREAFAEHLDAHALRREIIATVAVNYLINNAGIALLPRLTAGGRADVAGAMGAYLEMDRAAGAPALREALLAERRPAAEEQAALLDIEGALEPIVLARLEGQRPDADGPFAKLRSRLGL